jgi:carbon-monoxide dehydrogenase medium subunit
VYLPPSPPGAAGVFNKLGRTKIGDISIVSVAVYAWPLGNGRREWRITLGAVGPTPLRAPQAEAILSADASSGGVEAAATAAAEAARPIDDIRASARYRRAMVAVMTRRGIEAVLAQMEGGQ